MLMPASQSRCAGSTHELRLRKPSTARKMPRNHGDNAMGAVAGEHSGFLPEACGIREKPKVDRENCLAISVAGKTPIRLTGIPSSSPGGSNSGPMSRIS